MKIALVASRGGHLAQIKKICSKEIIGNSEAILITESDKKDEKIAEDYKKIFLFKKDILDINPINYFFAVFKFIKILKKEKIDAVITTGAHIAIPAFIAAKIIGIRTVFIETVIRVKTPTWSGRICYPFSDIFLVQNPELIRCYGKRTKYVGGII